MTAARTLRTACPSCGGTVPRSEGSRAERCPYCEVRSLLVSEEGGELRYSLKPRLDEEAAARRAVEQLVAREVLTKRLSGEVVLGDATLFFVPYLWLTATRPGFVARNLTRQDTRVVIDDFEAFSPAVDIPGWGLGAFDPSSILALPESPLPEPYEGAALRQEGVVLSPEKGFAGLERWAWGKGDESRPVVAARRRLLYVPVWSVPFRLHGQPYEARLDAVGGELLSARAPEDSKWRVPVALGSVALPSFLVGKLIASFFGSHGAVSLPSSLTFILLLVLTALLLGTSGFAWSLLRYEAIHIYEGGSLFSKQLGALGRSPLDKGAALLARLLGGQSPTVGP